MHNKRHGMDRDNRRSSNQQSNKRNYAAEDNKRQFQDQDYDRYFPEQNSYHPRNDRNENSQSQYGSRSEQRDQRSQQYGRSQGEMQENYLNQNYSGMENDYNTTDYGSSQYGSGYGSSYGYGTGYGSNQDYPNQRTANRSDYIHQSQGQSSSYGQTPYGQNSSQSWSQPVRNDEVPQGRTHFGKGPKGFKRSDDRIREEVSEALFHDHAVDASEIEVAVNDGEVTLSGTVSERRMKRLAEDCVEKVTGVKDVRNEIRVQASSFADRSEKTGSLPNTEESSSDRSSSLDKSKSKSPKLM